MSNAPIDFYCAFHLHQPVGNFGEVFESHIRDVYRPLLAHLAARPGWPMDLARGLVGVVADVGGLDRRQSAVVEEA